MADSHQPVIEVVGSAAWVARTRDTLSDAGLAVRTHALLHPVHDEAAVQRALQAPTADWWMLTSAHALGRARAPAHPLPPLACVGARTAAAARALGHAVQLVGDGGSAELAAALLALDPSPRQVLWLRGHEAVEAGAQALRSAGIDVVEIETYRMAIDTAVQASLGNVPAHAICVVGSPRSLSLLHGALGDRAGTILVIVLGAASAAAAEAGHWSQVLRVPIGDVDALIRTVREQRGTDNPSA